jgi:hypothetical protein
MFKRYWGSAIAVGLILLWVAPALSQQSRPPALKSDPIPNTGQQQRAQDRQAQPTDRQQPAPDLLPAIKSVEAAIREHVAKEDKAESERKEKREVADLKAQQDMVLWAKRMFWASVAGIGLTCVGLYMLYGTLQYTKKATEHAEQMVMEAKATTKFAEESMRLTREAMLATDRPWIRANIILISGLAFGPDKIEVEVRWSAVNIGKSPASHVTMDVGLYADVWEADRAAAEVIEPRGPRGALAMLSETFGRTLFPSEGWDRDTKLSLEVAEFEKRIIETANHDAPDIRPTANPAILLGVRYMIPGDDKFRYAYLPFELRHIDFRHPGWDSSEQVVPLEELELTDVFKAGRIT